MVYLHIYSLIFGS